MWGKRVLRKICGTWKSKYRRVVESKRRKDEIFGVCGIVKLIKAQRQRWLGHIMCMLDNRVAKIVIKEEINTKKEEDA